MPKTSFSGVHPASNKQLTEKRNICALDMPQVLRVPLLQHIGKPAKAVVAAGDKVAEGQKIGEADGEVSAHVFSPCSGVVKSVETLTTPLSSCVHVVIERGGDGDGQPFRFPPLSRPDAETIIRRVKDCGIVGMGGAGFPTHVKLHPKEKIDTFIINAAECEPYITCDYRIMLEYTDRFLRGALYLAAAVGLKSALIGLEDNKPEAALLLKRTISEKGYDVQVVTLPTKYPQGAEKQLIYAMTGRKVPAGGLPSRVGVIVDNVHTALSVCFAVEDGQPLYRRVITVSGGGIKRPENLWAPVGAAYKDIIEYCGGYSDTKPPVKLINGGPMTGISVSDDAIACTRTTSCLLLLGRDEAFIGSAEPCINCSACARACPMKLMPMYIDACILSNDLRGAVKYGADYCIECGCCAYVCPAKRPLVQSIRLAKKKSREAGRR